MTEGIGSSHKASKFKVDDRAMVTKYKNTFSKSYTKNCSKVLFVIDSLLKSNPWKIKDLNPEKIRRSFNEK